MSSSPPEVPAPRHQVADPPRLFSSITESQSPSSPLLRALNRSWRVKWHGFVGWAFSPGWFDHALLFSFQLALIAFPVWAQGWKHGLAYTLIYMVVAIWKANRDLSTANLVAVRRNRVEREMRLYRLQHRTQELLRSADPIGADSLRGYREEVLEFLASYVRDHRVDRKGTQIFVNLVAPEEEEMVVLARNQPHRQNSGRLAKGHSLAWQVMSSGEAKVVGDLYAEFPNTPLGKTYNSILAIPIILRDRTLGVVCIDSTRKYHFDSDFRELVNSLSPTIAMLAWTLDDAHVEGRVMGRMEPLKRRRK